MKYLIALFIFSYVFFSCINNSNKKMSFAGTLGSTTLVFDTIPYGSNDILAPGRGANTWYTYNQSAQIPIPGTTTWSLDNDTRFLWAKLQPTTAGVYKWDDFDTQIQYSIDHGQRFSFGVMTECSSCIIGDLAGDGNENVGGYGLGYPLFVHTAMQAEAVPDWKFSGGGNANMWIPNPNSNSFLSAWEAFLTALANHIATTTYKGIPYSSVIYHIDVRGYGNWGEWHTYPWRDCGCIPTGALASDLSLERIIAAHTTAFPNYPLIAMVGLFGINGDAGTANHSTAAVGYFGLMAHNNWGYLGIRTDHLGSESTDAWVPYETTLNSNSFNGLLLRDSILARWKNAPYVGEPLGTLHEVDGTGTSGGVQCPFYNLVNEVVSHHMSQFSNENLVGNSSCSQAFYLAASKAAGYRLAMKGGAIASTITTSSKLPLTIVWGNSGNAPVYENWITHIQLRNASGTVLHTWVSSFNPKRFLPGTTTITDSLPLNLIDTTGTALYIQIVDPLGYRKPLPLVNTGVQSDGSYLIKSGLVITGPAGVITPPPANIKPVANAGGNQSIYSPANTAVLAGSGSVDVDGTIVSYLWRQVSGPVTTTITSASSMNPFITGLTTIGTYQYNLTVTDNSGGVDSAKMNITIVKKKDSSSIIQPSLSINTNTKNVIWIVINRGTEIGKIVLTTVGPGINSLETITDKSAQIYRDRAAKKSGTYSIKAVFTDGVVKTATYKK